MQVQAKLEGGYYHGTDNLPQQIWMKNLPDSRLLNKITIPGTHDTASFFGGDMTQTQSLSVTQQLNAGIRFFDIRIKHEGNKFHIYHGIAYQHQDFDKVMTDITNFLKANPSEVLLMRISQARPEEKNTRSLNDTFVSYMKTFNNFMAYPQGNYNPRLCQLRGKILLYPTDKFPIMHQWGLDYHKAFDVQDDYHLVSNWDLPEKMKKVLAQITKANSDYKNKERKIFMNYLSGSGGSFPYFVASGKSSPGTGAPQLITGKGGVFEGTNAPTMDYLWANKAKIKYVGIQIADFPGAGLIKSIIDINDFNFNPDLGDVKDACPPSLGSAASPSLRAQNVCPRMLQQPKYNKLGNNQPRFWTDEERNTALDVLSKASGIASGELNVLNNDELQGAIAIDCKAIEQDAAFKALSTMAPDKWADRDRNTAIALLFRQSKIAVGKLQGMKNPQIAALLFGKK